MAKTLFGKESGAIKADDLFVEPVETEIKKETVNENLTVEQPQPEPAPEMVPDVEPKAEEEPAVESGVAEEPEGLNLEFFNKRFEKSFKSEDELLEALNKPTKESEYEELNKKYEDLTDKYELLLEQTDPSTFFTNEDAMRLEVFKKNNPKKDVAIAQKIFATEDLEQVDDMDMVKMGWKFNTPKLRGSDSDLEAMIAEDVGVDSDTPYNEWDVRAQNKLAVKAQEYRSQFEQMKSSVQLPQRLNIDELKTQRQKEAEERQSSVEKGWNVSADTILGEVKKIDIPVGIPKEGEEQSYFTWELDKLPQDEVTNIKKEFINRGFDVNDETKGLFKKALEMALLDKNMPLIMRKYGEDLLAKQEEKHLEETHNPAPLTGAERPEESEADRLRRERMDFASSGLGPSVSRKPLFNIKKE